ncbi:MAG: hypothetical protein LBD69_02385 [Puniceicoccales bacterium]|jgi:hypothetical protein|nr:hypothetical protein [Puniceicoccales bacterium]
MSKKFILFCFFILILNGLCLGWARKLKSDHKILFTKLNDRQRIASECTQLRQKIQAIKVSPIEVGACEIQSSLAAYFEAYLKGQEYFKYSCQVSPLPDFLWSQVNHEGVYRCHLKFYSFFPELENFIKVFQKETLPVWIKNLSIKRKIFYTRLFKVSIECDCLVKNG